LAISGGGTRGIIAATFADQIEKSLRALPGNQGRFLMDCFDLVVGTSTGTVLALGLDQEPRQDASKLVDLYLQDARTIFGSPCFLSRIPLIGTLWGGPKYSASGLESVLKARIGDAPMYRAAGPKVMATSFSLSTGQPWFFRSYVRPNEDCVPADLMFPRWEVARASSAAPTFLPPYRMGVSRNGHPIPSQVFVDGAVAANNPAICGMVEAIALWPQEVFQDGLLVVSIGTGTPMNLGIAAPYHAMRRWSPLNWIKGPQGTSPIVDSLMNGNEQTVAYETDWIGSIQNWAMFRYNLSLDGTVPIDVSDAATLQRLREQSVALCATPDTSASIKKLVALL